MCDTFVALPAATADGSIIFAKNSDRPYNEIQNITHYPHQKHPKESKVQCTYIEIPQVEKTYSVLLAQPDWMFGAEMGANEHGLVIGNEAVWTREPLGPPALLGMDLLRLALERCRTSSTALQTIVNLLMEFGQGGACGENDSSLNYHNSYLVADRSEAWVLETAGQWWVAERVKVPTRNISNNLSIRTDFDLAAEGIIDYAIEKGYHDQTGPFDFAPSFEMNWRESSHFSREGYGKSFLSSNYEKITPLTMMDLLRSCESGICMHGGFRSTASMVSHLLGSDQDVHWMTGTPHPCRSFFKPISFPDISLKPYNPASKSKDLNTFWWAHEEMSSFSKTLNWRQKERELISDFIFSDSTNRRSTTQEAFSIERKLYDSQLEEFDNQI
jgi:secernin